MPRSTTSRSSEFDQAREAARRWREREPERAQKMEAIGRGEFTKADDPGRLAARMRRRGKWVEAAATRGAIPAAALRVAASAPTLRADEITDALVERVIGRSNDLLSIEFFEQGLDAARCVGRVVTRREANGTGFLVAPGLMLTNEHVLRSLDEAQASELELDFEENRVGAIKREQTFRLLPDRFFLNDPELDFAFVAVDERSTTGASLADYGFRPLIAEEGKVTIGEAVNIIQHPEGRRKEIVIRDCQLVDLPEGRGLDAFFHYLADTERGSSGSPVFNDQWEVVALHHEGVPKTNERGELVDEAGQVLRRGQEDRIVWVANEGVRVSRLVRRFREATLRNQAEEELRRAALQVWARQGVPAVQESSVSVRIERRPEPLPAPLMPPPLRPSREAAAPLRERPIAAPPTPLRTASALELTVPLRISIGLGEPGSSSSATPVGAAALRPGDVQERVQPDPGDPDYQRRPGFQTGFLGFEVPLPDLSDNRHGPLATFGSDRGSELRYHHFSVRMNARRRLAYVAAVNIDSDAPFQHEREPGDRWFFDPRLSPRLQAGNEYYAENPLDRGHLVRRDDAAWGDTALEARLANDDTFHWTNCSPQHEIYNQADRASQRGLVLWGNLERAVSALARRYGNRICVLNGPIFSDTDRPYRQDFFLPGEFWKVIVVRGDDDRPHALAFRLSQAEQIATLRRERFAPDELVGYAPFQVRIADLETATGLDFLELKEWDPLQQAPDTRESAAETAMVRRIGGERDLIF